MTRRQDRPVIPLRSDPWHQRPERQNCLDCRFYMRRRPFDYMVRDEIWDLTGLSAIDGVLCLECLEKRIGRPLKRTDFRLTTPEQRARGAWDGQTRMVPEYWGEIDPVWAEMKERWPDATWEQAHKFCVTVYKRTYPDRRRRSSRQ
jgi:hypothetical protein